MTHLDREPETLREVLAEYIALWRNRGLARVMEAGYNDRAAIQADYERAVAASDAADARFWDAMRADGVPVTDPEPEPEAGL
jgi:hypothetical protein